MAASTAKYSGFVPGQIETAKGDIKLNAGRDTVTVTVENLGDRPIQIGSHYHSTKLTMHSALIVK